MGQAPGDGDGEVLIADLLFQLVAQRPVASKDCPEPDSFLCANGKGLQQDGMPLFMHESAGEYELQILRYIW